MNEQGFKVFLEAETTFTGKKYSKKGITTRISKAKAVEIVLGMDLDTVIQNEENNI